MSDPQQHITHSVESWEQREVQIRQERADEFAHLSPEERQSILIREKEAFDVSKNKLRQDLGFQAFNPDKGSADDHAAAQAAEEKARQAEIDAMDKALKTPSVTAQQPQTPETQPPVELQRFMALFDAAVENIERKTPFPFESVALDDFARPVRHQAIMTDLFDHSQQGLLTPGQISERLRSGQTKPEQISLRLMIDMGEDQNNSLGLTNLNLELSLSPLIEGQLIEKLARFTNLVLYAAVLHDRQVKAAVADRGERVPATTPHQEEKPNYEQAKTHFGITRLDTNGGLQGASGAFESGVTNSIAFSFNSGSVWGTLEEHGQPANPHELQEALDKISIEK